jgi:DNA-binding transcriptional LysR family regulator
VRAATGYDGIRGCLRYQGTDVSTLLALVAAGHGLALLPGSAIAGSIGVAGVPVSSPRLVLRIELVHGTVTGPAAALLAAVT